MGGRAVRVMAFAASAVVAVLMLGLVSAEARKVVRIPSHISIKGSGLAFSGTVTSRTSRCKRGRTVTLYRTAMYSLTGGSNGTRLGSTRTSSSGAWKIKVQGSAGITMTDFYAKVSQSAAGAASVCASARSRTIPYHS